MTPLLAAAAALALLAVGPMIGRWLRKPRRGVDARDLDRRVREYARERAEAIQSDPYIGPR